MKLPLTIVRRVEVFQGRHGRGGTGAMIGATLGFLLGYGIGATSGTSARGVIFGMIGAPALSLVGAASGATMRVERWSDVPLDKLRPARVPESTGMIRLALRLAF